MLTLAILISFAKYEVHSFISSKDSMGEWPKIYKTDGVRWVRSLKVIENNCIW